MNTLKNIQIKQLNYYLEWCVTIANFMSKKTGSNEIKEYWEKIKINQKQQDITEMKAAFNDMTSWALYLESKDRLELNKILRKKFNHDLLDIDKRLQKKIQSFIKKGKISNKEQYYLLREYFERIWDMPEYKETAKKIEDILFTFENKKGLQPI